MRTSDSRERSTQRLRALRVTFGSALGMLVTAAPAQTMVQLDPFAQATSGWSGCPVQAAPLLTEQEAGAESHARVERGTRCAM